MDEDPNRGEPKRGCAWSRSPPKAPGFYEVRVRPGVLLEGIDSRGWAEPLPRLVRIEAGAVCFDAGTIRGDIDGPLWEWQGPLVVPDKCPVG